MASEAQVTAAPPSKGGWKRFASVGPGVIFALSGIGARDLIVNSMAGSADGYSLLWVLVVAVIARMFILDATARYVLVTGESLLTGCGRLGRWAVVPWVGLWMLRQHTHVLGRAVMFGVAATFVFPLPTPHSGTIWGIVLMGAALALMFWGRYEWVEKLSKPLAAVMAGCLLAAVIASRPGLGDFLGGALHPVLPSEGGRYRSVIVLMAVLATAIGGGSANLRYAAFVHEKGWRSLDHLRRQRVDLWAGMLGSVAMLAMIQIAAAGVLRPRGIRVERVEDIVPIFEQVVGGWGQLLLGVTLLCVVFGAHVGSGAGFGIMVSDVYHNFIRPSKRITEAGMSPGKMPAYRWVILYLTLSPLYVFLTDWTPVGILVATGVLNVAALPIMMLIILRLTADRKVMGQYANNWLTNAAMILAILGSLYLSWEAVGGVLAELR